MQKKIYPRKFVIAHFKVMSLSGSVRLDSANDANFVLNFNSSIDSRYCIASQEGERCTRATPCDSHEQGAVLRVNISTIGLKCERDHITSKHLYHTVRVDKKRNFKNNLDKTLF